MTNSVFNFKNPNPPIIGPSPDPTKPRCIKAVVYEEKIHEPKRFVVAQDETNHEPVRRFVLNHQGE